MSETAQSVRISERAKDLWLALHEVHANEQAWPLIQAALDAEREDALREWAGLQAEADAIAVEDSGR